MSNNQQVAVIPPPRLAAPALLEEKYGIDPDQWSVLVDATFPSAKTTQGVLMALAYCKQRNLDIFRKCVHIVPMDTGTGNARRTIETVWPGIGELRVTAQRQADFFGWDECEFGPLIEFSGEAKVQKWTDGKPNGWQNVKWKGPVPEWARFTVYKMLHGQRVALPGPKVYFMETYSPVGRSNPAPNDRWSRAPRQMLEKCAEAAALRRAWPDVFGDEASFEEMEGKFVRGEAEPAAEGVDTRAAAGARPTRADFKGKPAETAKDEIVEGEFTEVQQEAAVDENAADAGEVVQEGDKPAENKPAKVDEKPAASDDKPERALPETRGQWEAWADGFTDALDDRRNVDQLDRFVEHNQRYLEAMPEDMQETLSAVVSARRAKLAEGADGAAGSTGGDQTKPAE
jgi:phage recombination protein Bet